MSVFVDASPDATPLYAVAQGEAQPVLDALAPEAAAYAAAVGFMGARGEVAALPGPDGSVVAAIVGLGETDGPAAARGLGAAPTKLPYGDYRLEAMPQGVDPNLAALAWAAGSYAFTRYKKAERPPARLVWPQGCDPAEVARLATAQTRARDLVNTPTEHMGPDALEAAVDALAQEHGADMRVTVGDSLLEQNFPMIHAVGRAAAIPPRFIEMSWGRDGDPVVAIIGKGVVFDSGGLNIKVGNYMRLMKKDMGGAANAIALAGAVMDAKLPVRLHLLIPAVENAISGNAFRPGDVIMTRKGLSVEIDNTDAEGRLILCEALTRAEELKAELVIDLATLTGAARVALGPEVMPFYTDDDYLAADLAKAAVVMDDPLWRMPLWDPYAKFLESQIADIANSGGGPFAGSITAALYLKRFAPENAAWVHFDIFAWNASASPARPEGGECMGVRAVYRMLRDRYDHPAR